MESWMSRNGVFIDIHESLHSFQVVTEFLQVVERRTGILDYCNGNNTSARWIFQIYSREFIESIASLIEHQEGPILEVLAGDGKLTEFLESTVDRRIIATDSKKDSHDIAYPKWIIELDALEAIERYNPSVVIMCWEPLYSDVGVNIVEEAIPLIWIGDPRKCAPESELMEREHSRLYSRFAIGRYDSLRENLFNTDIFLFNMDMKH